MKKFQVIPKPKHLKLNKFNMRKSMTILSDIQHDIGQVLKSYEDKNKILSKIDAAAITDIRKFTNEAETASLLLTHLRVYTDNMSGKLFGFFPFVADLKRELVYLIQKPAYRFGNLLMVENAEMNREIRIQRSKSDKNDSQLKERLDELEQHIADQQLQLGILKEELVIANKEIENYQKENSLLYERATNAESRVKKLEEEILNVVGKNADLMQEVASLRQQLHDEKTRNNVYKNEQKYDLPNGLKEKNKSNRFSFRPKAS